MTHLRRPWNAPRWGAHVLAAVAVVVSLAVALAVVLVPGAAPPGLTARGAPLPIPPTPTPSAAPTAPPVPQAAAPASGTPSPITLASVGPTQLVALDATAASSSTLGRAWVPFRVPSGVSGLVVDRANGDMLLAGGAEVQTTSDGGAHWTATRAQPAATGPYAPLMISPWDSKVLFVAHQGQVAVTTDGGATWTPVGVPAGGTPVMASGLTSGTFFVAAGGTVAQLVNNGAQVNHRPALPAGVTATSLSAGQFLLVACCSSGHLLILKGTKWNPTPITAAGPLAVNGTDLWAAVPATGASAPEAVEESSDGGTTWQARPGLPAGLSVLSLALSGDGHTVYALTSAGQVWEAQRGIWYLLSQGLQLGPPPS